MAVIGTAVLSAFAATAATNYLDGKTPNPQNQALAAMESEQIVQAAAEQQKGAERQGVPRHDPLPVVIGEAAAQPCSQAVLKAFGTFSQGRGSKVS